MKNDLGSVFRLGKVTFTCGANHALSCGDLVDALLRYMGGERVGDASEAWQLHFPFRLDGCRLLGTYRSSNGKSIWIVTEADRSRTTVMLPEEFTPVQPPEIAPEFE